VVCGVPESEIDPEDEYEVEVDDDLALASRLQHISAKVAARA
jgi:hypothetical protein